MHIHCHQNLFIHWTYLHSLVKISKLLQNISCSFLQPSQLVHSVVHMTHSVADTSWSRRSDTCTVSTAPRTPELPSLQLHSRASKSRLLGLWVSLKKILHTNLFMSHGFNLLVGTNTSQDVFLSIAIMLQMLMLLRMSYTLGVLRTHWRAMWVFMFVLI